MVVGPAAQRHWFARLDPRLRDFTLTFALLCTLVTALLNQLIDMFRPQAAEKGLSFDFVVEGELPAGVRCDDKRLSQILINLLSNALKFTRSGQVTLAVDCRRETTSFLIADTGPGIAPEDLERIFQPFERGGGATPGVGLGLTIARLLTGLMGGELTADSERGRGSNFRVRLLLPKLRPVRQVESGRPPIVGYRGARRQLLVADDQGAHRLVLCGMLEPLGLLALNRQLCWISRTFRHFGHGRQ